jgi:hypothetical protein
MKEATIPEVALFLFKKDKSLNQTDPFEKT